MSKFSKYSTTLITTLCVLGYMWLMYDIIHTAGNSSSENYLTTATNTRIYNDNVVIDLRQNNTIHFVKTPKTSYEVYYHPSDKCEIIMYNGKKISFNTKYVREVEISSRETMKLTSEISKIEVKFYSDIPFEEICSEGIKIAESCFGDAEKIRLWLKTRKPMELDNGVGFNKTESNFTVKDTDPYYTIDERSLKYSFGISGTMYSMGEVLHEPNMGSLRIKIGPEFYKK